MKKIIFLEVLLTAVIVVLVILIGIGVYALSLVSDSNTNVLVLSTVVQVIFLAGLVLARMALSSFITRGFFNNRGAIYLKCSGWLLMIFGILSGGISISSTLSKDQMFSYLFYLIVLMIGLGLTIISDLVAKGEDIENENKLTI